MNKVIRDNMSHISLELTNEQLYEALEEMDEYHEAAIESLRSQ